MMLINACENFCAPIINNGRDVPILNIQNGGPNPYRKFQRCSSIRICLKIERTEM